MKKGIKIIMLVIHLKTNNKIIFKIWFYNNNNILDKNLEISS